MRLKKINKNKRALSEIVSYALLILIALAIGTLIFVWLLGIINDPKTEKCPEDGVSIVIREAICHDADDKVEIAIANQGRFNISGFVVKGSNNPGTKALINLDPNDAPATLADVGELNIIISKDLGPGEEGYYNFSYSALTPASLSKISVVAIRNQSEKMAICTNSLAGQDVSCS